MKMQGHMMKNMQQMPPSTEQQRTIQLQMLAHMKKQFKSEPDLQEKIVELEKRFIDGELNPIETNMKFRGLQQELMGRRMNRAVKQMKEKEEVVENKGNEEEEAPMRVENDEDL